MKLTLKVCFKKLKKLFFWPGISVATVSEQSTVKNLKLKIVMESKPNTRIDVLIIGAGLSGLTSAMKIKEKEPSLKIRILEASNKMGGQLRQVSLGEIGAKWISEDQCHIYRLLKTLNVKMHKRNFLSPQLKSYEFLDEGVFSRLAKYEIDRYINELELKLEFYKTVSHM